MIALLLVLASDEEVWENIGRIHLNGGMVNIYFPRNIVSKYNRLCIMNVNILSYYTMKNTLLIFLYHVSKVTFALRVKSIQTINYALFFSTTK